MNVLTLGTFDLWHVGHVNLLRRCRRIAGHGSITVAVNTDEFVEAFKHHAPVIPFQQRIEVVSACRFVDAVVANDQTTVGSPANVVFEVAPDAIVVGSDWQGRDYLAQLGLTAEELDAAGIQIFYVPYTDGISSTMVREAMRA
jgi:cytidyltransferase-like protein